MSDPSPEIKSPGQLSPTGAEFQRSHNAERPNQRGWFKATRGDEPLELIRANPNAFTLAFIIAHRARWREGFNRHGLGQGEAMLGDYKSYGMSAREYRTAREQLAKWGFATFKTTNAGTIGKLIDTRLFSTANESDDKRNDTQATNDRHASDKQATTNEEGKKGTRGKKERKDSPELARVCEEIYQAYPNKVGKPAALKAIAKALDKRTGDELLTLTQAYAKARGTDMSFVPHPATWFNQERFNDEPATWIRPAAPQVSKRNQGTSHEGIDHEAYNR